MTQKEKAENKAKLSWHLYQAALIAYRMQDAILGNKIAAIHEELNYPELSEK